MTLGFTHNDGELLFEGSVPITDAKGRLSVPSLAVYRSFSFLGRSANVLAAVPYGVGTFSGTVFEESRFSVYRSGLFDAQLRVAVNLVGGRAMSVPEFRQWRQSTLLGVSLKVVPPTGQYDPTKLINLGSNRWTFKPELGLSHRHGHFVVDAYGAVYLFGRNPEFFSRNAYVPGTQSQAQEPIVATELHLSYDVRPRLWASLDGNFWYGGRTSLEGVENPRTLQQSSRVGATVSFPVTRRGSVKLSYARGAYVRFGGDYRIYSAAWQYSWLDKPRAKRP